MSNCRRELVIQGATNIPRSCPLCGISEKCVKGYEKNTTAKFKYAAIVTKTIHHEGDERSRTHPGHGYPAYDENIESIEYFDSLEHLKNWVKSQEGKIYYKPSYKLIKYQELKVTTEITINVEGTNDV